MNIIIGSARSDERGAYSGGAPGDQKQTTTPDYKGEVSMQNFYVHKKGWIILRPKSAAHVKQIAANMKSACNNKNIGYSQSDRYGVIKYGIHSSQKTNADCSSLVRACVREATGRDPGDFNTSNEAQKLMATGLFEKIEYKSGMKLYEGDVLVTKTKGHTVAVTDGYSRDASDLKQESGNPYVEPGSLLRKGSKGEGVKWLQYELNQEIFSGSLKGAMPALVIDGDFGSKTLDALKAFQKAAKIEVDGICGPDTRRKLKG